MKSIVLIVTLLALGAFQTAQARTVEIDVHGMTCTFCVDSLQRKFGEMDSVSSVDVSLKQKKVRLETDAALPTLDTIRQAVLDAGFTPVKVSVLADASDKK